MLFLFLALTLGSWNTLAALKAVGERTKWGAAGNVFLFLVLVVLSLFLLEGVAIITENLLS